ESRLILRPFLPGDPLQVRNGTLHIHPLTVRTGRFTNRAPPVENARNTDRQKARTVQRVPTSKSPQRKCFKLAFGDQHESIYVAQRSLGPWWQVEHVPSSRRTEVLL